MTQYTQTQESREECQVKPYVSEMAGQDHLEIYHKPRQWESPQDTNNLETLNFTHRKSLPTHGVGKDELYFTLKKLKLVMSDR